MKITGLRYERLRGTLDYDGPIGEDHRTGPLEVYPEYRARRPWFPLRTEPHDPPYPITGHLLHIDTDAGLTGTYCCGGLSQARIIDGLLKPALLGENALATERLWDIMYRTAIHGRKGETMMAISAVDLALWDLKGKAYNAPVHALIGGPTRERIRAYASMLGYSMEPDKVYERSRELVKQGYTAIKWFMSYSPPDGEAGVRANLEMIRAAREAVGPDVDLMFDAWSGWDVPYTQRMAALAAEYRPYWFEEVVFADLIPQYAELRRTVSGVAIAGGEHEYTRWGAKALLDAGAVDILQMDVTWGGGLSEFIKIAGMASAHGIPLIPHYGAQASSHLIASQAPTVCPIQEYLIQTALQGQFFFADKCVPVDGYFTIPTAPGLGMALDESVVEAREELVL